MCVVFVFLSSTSMHIVKFNLIAHMLRIHCWIRPNCTVPQCLKGELRAGKDNEVTGLAPEWWERANKNNLVKVEPNACSTTCKAVVLPNWAIGLSIDVVVVLVVVDLVEETIQTMGWQVLIQFALESASIPFFTLFVNVVDCYVHPVEKPLSLGLNQRSQCSGRRDWLSSSWVHDWLTP